MRPEEFTEVVGHLVSEHAAEISANYDVDIARARLQAENDLDDDLELGLDTPGHHQLSVVTDELGTDQTIGVLWCKPETTGPSVFTNDFYIKPPRRGHRHAKRALDALQTMFQDAGYSELRLRVAADSEIAQRLYLTTGFRVTGINMKKSIWPQLNERSSACAPMK
ncbi:GNAT family N-acetyltransferase [Jannaschia sp. CCS1]|uniref:GNAT family N-acetyltransferase n=1 Tax=Jannaschia sp. (strain CCS1) TaxID=290400 RepID=UPI000053B5E2|nr:GNAT family N-acetyltransferase [Jannaschia sp. CCS1]ABD55972.1 GCN5-related N-acetyltransferase [Jannaschia sp. CCS1]